MNHHCAECGKFWIFKTKPKYWLRRKGPCGNVYLGDGVYVVPTNYHDHAGQIFCHPCWPVYVQRWKY